MAPFWRQSPETEHLLTRSAALHADLMSTMTQLELFVSALNTDTQRRDDMESESATLADHEAKPPKSDELAARGTLAKAESNWRGKLSDAAITGREVLAKAESTARHILADAESTGRDVLADAESTGRDVLADAESTGRDVLADAATTGREVLAEASSLARDVVAGAELAARKVLAETAVALTSRVDELIDQVEETETAAQKFRKKIIFSIVAMGVVLVVIGMTMGFIISHRLNVASAQQEVTRAQVACPIIAYELNIGPRNASVRNSYPGGPLAYDKVFSDLEQQSQRMSCQSS